MGNTKLEKLESINSTNLNVRNVFSQKQSIDISMESSHAIDDQESSNLVNTDISTTNEFNPANLNSNIFAASIQQSRLREEKISQEIQYLSEKEQKFRKFINKVNLLTKDSKEYSSKGGILFWLFNRKEYQNSRNALLISINNYNEIASEFQMPICFSNNSNQLLSSSEFESKRQEIIREIEQCKSQIALLTLKLSSEKEFRRSVSAEANLQTSKILQETCEYIPDEFLKYAKSMTCDQVENLTYLIKNYGLTTISKQVFENLKNDLTQKLNTLSEKRHNLYNEVKKIKKIRLRVNKIKKNSDPTIYEENLKNYLERNGLNSYDEINKLDRSYINRISTIDNERHILKSDINMISVVIQGIENGPGFLENLQFGNTSNSISSFVQQAIAENKSSTN